MRNFKSLIIAGLLALAPLAASAGCLNGNCIPLNSMGAYTPTFAGQTDNPTTPTYTTQFGRYYIIGNLVYVEFKVVTSGITSKTTTSDLFAVTLPVPAQTVSGANQYLTCDVENATAVTLGLTGVIASGGSQATFLGYNAIVAGKNTPITWATTTPGIGVLSNAITAQCSGFYEGAF